MAISAARRTAAPKLLASVVLAALPACGHEAPTPVPTPTPGFSSSLPPPGVAVGHATGPTDITLVALDPPAGTTIPCGTSAEECAGSVRMTFRLRATGTGTVLWCTAFLHAADKTACLSGLVDGFPLVAGESRTVDLVFDVADSSDRCRTPLEITDLAFVAEGTVEVASRQEWALRYRLTP
jgi:hypothetical protein